jgi:hypothetical protein
MIKKSILAVTLITAATLQIKSQDVLVGKKIFQGDLNLNVRNIKTTEANPSSILGIQDVKRDKTFGIGTYGLFGKIDSKKSVFSVGFNINVAQDQRYTYQLNGDTIRRVSDLKLTVGPTLGSAKFISISDNFYFAPATTFNIYGIVEKNTAKYPGSAFSNFLVTNEENKNGIGVGVSLYLVPLRIAYLWKENVLLTASIGSIGGVFEYQESNGEVNSNYFNNNTNNYVTETLKIKESKFNANIIGRISNFASFGVSYLFK